jgi:hypothetical protein
VRSNRADAGEPDSEAQLAGDVYVVRSFRIGPDGGLCAVTRPETWGPGWNYARCGRGGHHPAPHAGCTCGLYAYSHPEYAAEQPTARTCVAVIATNGAIMAGARGVRMGRARIAAVWLCPAVPEGMRSAVAAAYPETAVFKDKAAMFAEFPTSELPGFSSPRASRVCRRAGHAGLAGLVMVAAGLGVLPAALVGAHPGLRAAIAAVVLLCMLVALGGGLLRARGGPVGAHMLLGGAYAGLWLSFSAGLGRPEVYAACLHAAVLFSVCWYVWVWRRAGQPGRPLYPRWVTALPGTIRRRPGQAGRGHP